MSHNYYSEINLHLTWRTKENSPLLTPRVEPLAHGVLRQRLLETEGVFVHQIGGTENHVHVAVSVPPTVLIADFVGQVKGFTSHELNNALGKGAKVLQWQAGYGVVTFGTKDLAWVKRYILDQREHHAQGKVFDRLERVTAIETGGSSPDQEAP